MGRLLLLDREALTDATQDDLCHITKVSYEVSRF